MLFNSAIFLFAFLPVALMGYYALLARLGQQSAQLWLFGASLFFYGWWNPIYLPLLLTLMAFSYFIGQKLQANRNKKLLIFGIATNLGALGYFKYADFFIDNVNTVFGAQMPLPGIILPLGISFFIFQKIAYLVDSYKGLVPKNQNWINFGLFVSFFPQLIAGPIVHHKEMMPQFAKGRRFSKESFTAGLCLLAIGLFKKTILADGLEVYVTPLFDAAQTRELHFIEAWVAALAYTFQIYFDFSGYCDMALGLGKMFGIRLPVNFYSPYKSKNIIEFWRRWHMTLSRFLRDYLYIPLGGNRKGKARRYLNLLATMLLGGLWHGANWTFVVWGALHGTYLVINHFWQGMPKKMTAMPKWFGQVITFLAVCVAWVFFRAADVHTATGILKSMVHITDMDGLRLDRALFSRLSPLRETFDKQTANIGGILIILSFIICWALPNAVEIMRLGKPAISGIRGFVMPKYKFASWLCWYPSLRWGVVAGFVTVICVIKVLYEPSQVFLYFQF